MNKSDEERNAYFKEVWARNRANRGSRVSSFDVSRYDQVRPLYEQYRDVTDNISTLPGSWEELRAQEIEIRSQGGKQGPLSKFAAWMYSGGGQEWLKERMAAKIEAANKQRAAEEAARALAERQEKMRRDQKAQSLADWHAKNGLPKQYQEFLTEAVNGGQKPAEIESKILGLKDGDLMWPYVKPEMEKLIAAKKARDDKVHEDFMRKGAMDSASRNMDTGYAQKVFGTEEFKDVEGYEGVSRERYNPDNPFTGEKAPTPELPNPGVPQAEWAQYSREEKRKIILDGLRRGYSAELKASQEGAGRGAGSSSSGVYTIRPGGEGEYKVISSTSLSELIGEENITKDGDLLSSYDSKSGTGYRGPVYKTANSVETLYWKDAEEVKKYIEKQYSDIGTPTSVSRLQSKGFIPNFSAKLAEVIQARALGATPSVKAKNSRGTINGKPFILNNQETEYTGQELVGMGLPRPQNNDSMVLRKYGPKTQGKELAQNLGMANAGFVPNFANGLGTDMSGFTEGAKEVTDAMSIFKESTEKLLQGVTSTITTDLNITGLDIPSIVEAIKEALAPVIANAVSQQVSAQASVNPNRPQPPGGFIN